MAANTLSIDVEGAAAIGFLVHVQRLNGAVGEPPEGGWFPLDSNRRVPTVFPIGLPASVEDPDIEWLRDMLLGREREVQPPPPATKMVEIIEVWRRPAALAFIRDMVVNRHISLQTPLERNLAKATAEFYANDEGALTWDATGVRVNEDDDRTLIMLGSPVFRERFGKVWPCDRDDEDGDLDEDDD
jgi:hypothetical protein